MRDPEFIIFTGPMFGSKTTRMLACVDRYRYQHKLIAVFKPKIDDRYETDKIKTHSGLSIQAHCVESGYEIADIITKIELASLKRVDVIAVDEAFMIEGCSSTLIQLFKTGYTIVIASIQLSATGEPFNEIKDILPWGTRVEVCPAVCSRTGEDAYYTFRKVECLDSIMIGGSDMYEARCWSSHPGLNSLEKLNDRAI